MRTVEDHRAAIEAVVRPLAPRAVPLDHADGCVAAEDVHALVALPPTDNSAMDGYAVLLADVAEASPERPVRLRVVADLPAGSGAEPDLAPGTCARIMTGAPAPRSADAVVPVEQTDGGTDVVEIRAAARPGQHIRRAAEDVRVGDLVLTAGTVLGATQIAAVAATGHGSVLARPRPRVAVVSTGSELVPPGEALGRGLIPDSNSFLLAACVREAGCDAVRVGAVPDDADRLGAVLQGLLSDGVDAVVTSGGVSVGAFDVVKELFVGRGDGAVTFVNVAMQPGKPQGFGVLTQDGPPVFALPGNPVSAFVSFEAFVRPALSILRGLPDDAVDRPVRRARAVEGWACPKGRRQYIPVVATEGPAGWTVRPAGPRGSGSHLAVTLGRANALAVVPAEVVEVREGDDVAVMLTGTA